MNKIIIGSWLLEGMDNTTNPCDDFYQFACGTYMRQHNRSDVNIENVSSSVGHAIPFEYSSNKGLGKVIKILYNLGKNFMFVNI